MRLLRRALGGQRASFFIGQLDADEADGVRQRLALGVESQRARAAAPEDAVEQEVQRVQVGKLEPLRASSAIREVLLHAFGGELADERRIPTGIPRGDAKSLAREVASRNITVNVVAPGLIETDMTRAITDAAQQNWADSIPLGRLGTPDDVANAVCFLASDAASYITGHVLAVNGGMYS